MFEGDGHRRVRAAPAPAGLPICHGAENVRAVDWTAQNWNDLIPRLYLVAVWRLKRVRGAIRCAAGADHLVNDAIAKTIGGARTWSQENCTLFQHLAGVIISDISHLTTSSEARLTVVYRGSGGADWPPDIADETPNQEQLQEWRSEQQGLLNHLAGSIRK